MNTIGKGRLSYNIVENGLLRNNFEIFTPVIESGKIDCIAIKNKKIYRMQIKTIEHYKNKKQVPLRKKNHSRSSNTSYLYTVDDIDFMVGVDTTTQDIFFIPISFLENYTSVISTEKIQDFKNNIIGAL